MECLTCQRAGIKSALEVKDTRKDRRGLAVRRRRVCAENPTHVLDTLEQPVLVPLDGVFVRAHQDPRRLQRFSRKRLTTDIQDGVLKRLDPTALASVVDGVCGLLEDELGRLGQPATDDNRAAAGESVQVVVDDWRIRTLVERRLREQADAVAHVLFALSFRGRVDMGAEDGWQDAREFLGWLYEVYPKLRQELPERASRAEERWWPPAPPQEPTRVIKRAGRPSPFRREQLEDSVRKALLGRQQSLRKGRLIVDWALWQLAGQDTVLTSQLAGMVVNTLRRVDDIAYLRYAGIAKAYETVEEYADEALALVRTPGPELIFDKRVPRSPSSGGFMHGLVHLEDLAQALETVRANSRQQRQSTE